MPRLNQVYKRFIGETAVKETGRGSRSRLEEPGTCERREGGIG